MQNGSAAHQDIPPLTGIRAIAVFWVLFFHLKFFIIAVIPGTYTFLKVVVGAGNLGVDLFFILSGFIISYNYANSIIPFKWQTYRHYLWNRIARIYPVHLFTLFLMGICVGLIEPGASIWYVVGPKFKIHFTLPTFIENVLMIQAWIIPVTRSWNFFSWSISCEWLVYLIFPFFMWFLFHIKNKFILLALVLLALLGLSLYCEFNVYDDILRYGIIRVIPQFFIGCILFRLYQVHAFTRLRWDFLAVICTFIAIIGGGFASVFYLRTITWVPWFLPWVIYGVSWQQGPFSQLLSTRFMQYWGKVSYSLYMSSCVSIYLATKVFSVEQLAYAGGLKGSAIVLIDVTFILISGAFTYHFVEEPLRKWLKKKGEVHSPF